MSNATLTSEPSPETISGSRVISFDQDRERVHRKMLSSVAHDLKTPLASIIGSLEIYTGMQKKLSPEKQAELIKVALQEAHRLDNFITNILDMAKLESGVVRPKPEDVDIELLLNNCLTRMDNRLRGSSIGVRGASGPLRTMIDSMLLSRAISLVLDNALRYGGIPPVIQIEFGQDDMGYIRIRDNGNGMPEDKLETVFSKHAKLDTHAHQSTSLGLGLSIAREIMLLLGGEVIAANHADGGAVFTLRFPVREA